MKLTILQTGNPILRQRARELSAEEILSETIQNLISSMQETMHDAPGVGLAAPQIGESIQLAIIEDREEFLRAIPPEQLKERARSPVPFYVIINPKISIESPANYAEFYEGCLSVSPFMGAVSRALAVKVECLNENAQPVTISAKGWHARILQHEIDHLQGVLCIDHMNIRTLTTVENYIQFWLK